MKLKLACLAVTMAAIGTSSAQAENAPYSLFGDGLEHLTGFRAFGFLQLGYAKNNTSNQAESGAGHTNFPIVGAADESLQWNSLQIALERSMATNILPRITPLPGPMPWEFSWGARVEALYGRDGLPAQMIGLDSKWNINKPTAFPPGSDRQNFLATPQAYLQFFFPVWQGVALTLGRFGSGVGTEIPPAWRPGPNTFYTKTYAFVAQPDQVFGGLLSANLMRNEFGLLAGELGVVKGRQVYKDNNNKNAIIGALRWRSGDMGTWVDYSFFRGDDQNDFGKYGFGNGAFPTSTVYATTGQLRTHHSLSASWTPADRWHAVIEYVYGKQDGDGSNTTFQMTPVPIPGFTGASYNGINGKVIYKATDTLSYAARYEVFNDKKGIALAPVSFVPSSFNAVTIGLQWDANKNVQIRPEIRRDWQSNYNGVAAFNNGHASRTTFAVDAVLHF